MSGLALGTKVVLIPSISHSQLLLYHTLLKSWAWSLRF